MKEDRGNAEPDNGSLPEECPQLIRTLVWLRRHGRKHWKYVLLLALLVVGGLLWKMRPEGKGSLPRTETPSQPALGLSVDPNTHRTALFVRTKGRVDERTDRLIREKVHPWLFMTPGSKVTVTLHNARAYTYSGSEFEGTPRDIFWKDLIDPFLEEAAQQVLDEVGKECRSNGKPPGAALKEAGWLLEGMVRRVYREMVDVDQGLRGKGFPDSVPKMDGEWQMNRLIGKVRDHVAAATALYSGPAI